MVLPPLIFMVDSTMNLMNGLHYECERRKHHSLYFGVPKNYFMFKRLKTQIYFFILHVESSSISAIKEAKLSSLAFTKL